MGPADPPLSRRLPPPFLGTRPLGELPGAGEPVGDDPILGAYDAQAGGEAEPETLPIGPDEVTAFLVGLGDVLARIRGPHWAIEPDETTIMAPAIARQLSRPGSSPIAAWIAAHGDAAAIILGTAVIVVPRALTEYQVIRWRRRQLEAELAAQETGAATYGSPGTAERPPAGGPGAGIPGAGAPGAVNPRPTDDADLTSSLGALTRR